MATQTKTEQATSEEKTQEFVYKVLGDLSGTFNTAMCIIGDRLGLFKELESKGPATSVELAKRSGIRERYAREWLSAMACGGYLEYDPVAGRFSLPPEHAPALAQEAGPVFFGGVQQMSLGMLGAIDGVTRAFRDGGGVSQQGYSDDMWAGLERFTAGWFENLLLTEWIPAVPAVKARLERGADVADLGCGNGRALIKLAQAFPKSRYIGYDVFKPAVANAARNARAAGVGDRVRFEHLDVSQGIPEKFDVISTWDVIHDMVDPRGALKSIRQALRPDGTYLILDINCSDRLEENVGPLGALFYGCSVLYCMTTSLAGDGEGLGTLGLPPSRVRELCAEAGFSKVNQLPLENPFNILYEVKP